MKKRVFALIFLGLFFLLPLAVSLVSALTSPSCQQIGTGQEGWYENEQLIMNTNCSGCKSACQNAGTEQEGWYNSCDQSLIKYEGCNIACYTDDNFIKDHKIYCKDSNACADTTRQKCENPGSTLSKYVDAITTVCTVCAYGCSEGSCKSQEPQTTCTDSDGEDYYTRGYVKTQLGGIEDICSGSTQVYEGLCKDGKYTSTIYTCPEVCKDGACAKQGTWTGVLHIDATESVCEQCVSTPEKSCRCDSNKIYNFKVSLYDLSGNLISSADTTTGALEFSGLKEGKYVAITNSEGYNPHTLEANLGPNIGNGHTITLQKIGATTVPSPTTPPSIVPMPLIYWYRNAYWQCYDGYEEYSGSESSCKPPEVWKNYAGEACKEHCSNETKKCGVNTFRVYNECAGKTNVQPSVCGNGICESGEGERCEIMAIACEIGKNCEAQPIQPAKCYYSCEQDCKKTGEEYVNAKLNEKFKLQMSQEARFNDLPLKIKFNDFFLPKCEVVAENAVSVQESVNAVVEKYNPMTGAVIASITGMPSSRTERQVSVISNEDKEGAVSPPVGSRLCKEGEPYAVLQIKFGEEKNMKTEVIKLQVGEKKRVFDLTISFLDYDIQSRTVLFLVSKEAFECPMNCICDLAGNITECKRIEKCPEKTMLCQDGVCRNKCEIKNMTTECNFGCFYNEKCLPYGLRINKLYCSIEDNMKSQLTEEESCDNNFECQTNVCVNGKCISAGLIQRILDWFKKLFGG
ncbi:MAG: hypothetical protein V1660_02065 [archaeon]